MSKLFKIVKKILITVFLIYGYNTLAQPLNLIIPFNIITIIYVMCFGCSGLLSLIFIYLFGF